MNAETEDMQNTGGLRPEYKTYERQKCFVGHSREAEWRDDLLSACAEVLPKFGLEPWYAADHFDPTKPLRDKVVELIANARYGIYDLSSWQDRSGQWHLPRNVFIELGMAIALNRPALLLRHTSDKAMPLPACLQGVELLEFAGETTLKRALEERLPQWFDVPPDRDWLNRFCIFGNRVCDFREEHPRARQWGYETLHCHVSDGLDRDHPCFQKAEREEIRGAFENVFSHYSDLVLGYLDELSLIDGYQFLLCSYCHTVRSTPFAVYRILPHTPAEVFIAIGMSIALEALFEYSIPKVLLVRQEPDLPSLLRGYEVVEAVNSSEVKKKLKAFIPAVVQKVREAAWKPKPLPSADIAHVEQELTPSKSSIHLIVEWYLRRFANWLADAITVYTNDIDKEMEGQSVTVAGVVSRVRPHTSHQGEPMAFVQLEDQQGSIEVVVSPRVFQETHELWQPDRILVVRGLVDVESREPKILCESVQGCVTFSRPRAPRHLSIVISCSGDHERDINLLAQVHELLIGYQGEDSFSLCVPNGARWIQLDFPDDTTRYCPELQTALSQMAGISEVRVD